ncbi:cation:dicarboxylate symporter family transporter [Halococcus hamelinensis]|nr:cation:dicarboxylase symporter family transporter [Halococcus hamelinensis]
MGGRPTFSRRWSAAASRPCSSTSDYGTGGTVPPGNTLVGSAVSHSAVSNSRSTPAEVIAMIAGIDPLLDRLRTMNNVAGDLAVSTVVGKWNDAVDLTAGVWAGGVGDGDVVASESTAD